MAKRNLQRARLHAAFVLFAILAFGVQADEPGAGQTQLFGVTGSGSRFVYVFDRSLSMKGPALAAAKRELLASLSKLERTHQFQIVFYNEQPKMMQPPRMLFADESGQGQAASFVTNMTAAGGTDHVAALKLALRMQPDVIFLLTDADEPPLTAKQLNDVHRANGGAVINVIEFKGGPNQGKGAFLRQLADENRGQYKYVDSTALPADR
jgi:hypothetical protein